MPIYEYRCETCGKVFEYQQRITEEPLKVCPPEICESTTHKGQGNVHRLISKGVGLVFKGNGFYITDYARKNSSIATASKPSDSEGSKNITSATENK
jgi:putative FmdB family regulatory protein